MLSRMLGMAMVARVCDNGEKSGGLDNAELREASAYDDEGQEPF